MRGAASRPRSASGRSTVGRRRRERPTWRGEGAGGGAWVFSEPFRPGSGDGAAAGRERRPGLLRVKGKLAGILLVHARRRQTMTRSAISWKPARKCADDFRPTIARDGEVDAEMGEGLAVDRLLAERGDQDLDAALGQERRRPHPGLGGAQHRRGAAKASVAERDDPPGPGQRLLSRPLPAPAEAGRASPPMPPAWASAAALRIVHDADHGALARPGAAARRSGRWCWRARRRPDCPACPRARRGATPFARSAAPRRRLRPAGKGWCAAKAGSAASRAVEQPVRGGVDLAPARRRRP